MIPLGSTETSDTLKHKHVYETVVKSYVVLTPILLYRNFNKY